LRNAVSNLKAIRLRMIQKIVKRKDWVFLGWRTNFWSKLW